MDNIIDTAAYVIRRYREVAEEQLDEMKLHKLLYFTQRETLAITGEPAFEGQFEGWRYGPVSREVREAYYDGEIIEETNEITDGLQYIVNNVVDEYGAIASWKLSELSHRETSWQNAREGLESRERGSVYLKLEDIRKDAEKVRPYDHVWDMYYDEFEDAP